MYTNLHSRTRISNHTIDHTPASAHTRARTHIHTQTRTHTHMLIHTHTLTHTGMHECTHARTHTSWVPPKACGEGVWEVDDAIAF